MAQCFPGAVNKMAGAAIEGAATHQPGKSFGEAFAEKKSKLDNLQKNLAGAILPSIPGQSAAKITDMGMGIDFHATVTPPSPMMPIPNLVMVYDIIGAIFAALDSVLPEAPEAPEPQSPDGEQQPVPIKVKSVARAIVTMMKPSVKVNNQYIANAGTSIQHLPGVFAHLPSPVVAPMAEGEVFMGSSSVLADGAPFTYRFLPALSCNLVGIPAPFRMKKATKKTKLSLMAPTVSLHNVMPKGMEVLVGGPPTIDLFAMAINLGLKGFGKLWKRGVGGFVQKAIDRMSDKYPRLKKFAQKSKCVFFGEPVDVVTGRVYAENEEFSFPGAIPFTFKRTYYSDMDTPSPLGRGWSHNYDVYHSPADSDGDILLHWTDGRTIAFPAIAIGDAFYHPVEKLKWKRTSDCYILEDTQTGLFYHFQSYKHAKNSYKLSRIYNMAGDAIQVDYGVNNQVSRIIDTAERCFTFKYEDAKNRMLLTKIELENKQISWKHQYSYNEESLLSNVIDAGEAEKKFYYNDAQLLCRLTNQMGVNFYWEYDKDARCIHTWGDEGILEYHSRYEKGKTMVTNSLGHTTVYEYNSDLLITQITDARGGVTVYRYNHWQDKVLAIDPMGNSTHYSYDAKGNLLSLTNALEETAHFEYDEKDRLISSSTFGGSTTKRVFNEHNQVTQISYPNGKEVYLSYEKGKLSEITDQDASTTRLQWDEEHNLIGIESPSGAKSRMEYDTMGRLLKSEQDNGAVTQYVYDTVGNILELIEPTGNHHRFTYDTAGNVLTAQDHSRSVSFKYWGLGHLKERSENGNKVVFHYDTEEQLKSIRNEAREVYSFSRDANGDIEEERGFDGLKRKYQRDLNGQVTQAVSPLHTANYRYNQLGLLTNVHYEDGSYELYDYNRDGQLILAENARNQVRLLRNANGEIVEEIQNGHKVAHQYNTNGQRTHFESSMGISKENSYNSLGQLIKSEVFEEENLAWNATHKYNRMGFEIERILNGTLSQETQYDRAGRITLQRINGKNYELGRREYFWNPASQLKKLIANGSTTEFDYDAVGNLASAVYNQTEKIYKLPDRIGNLYKSDNWDECRETKYDHGSRLIEDKEWHYTYDAEGNLTQKNSKTKTSNRFSLLSDETDAFAWFYTWNANGNLQKVYNNEGVHLSFEYDALGRRTAKINHKTQTIKRFLWDGNVPLHEWEYDLDLRPELISDKDGILTYKTPGR